MSSILKKGLTPPRVIYFAKALEGAAYSSCMPFLLLHFMKTLGLTAVASGVIMSAREMVPIFTAIAMGWVVAKSDRKAVLVISLLALSASIFAFRAGLAGQAGLIGAALVSGLSNSALRIAFSSSIADFMSKEESAQGFASLHAASNVGFAVGPLISGYWVASQDYANAFWVSIGLYFLAALAIYFLLPHAAMNQAESREPVSIKEIGLSLKTAGLLFLFSVLAVFFVNGIRTQIDLLGLAKYFVDYFGSTRATSLYWTIQSIAVVFLVPLSGRWMKGWTLKALFASYVIGSIISAIAYVSLGFFAPQNLISGFAVLIVLSVIGECLWAPCLGAILINLVGKGQVGFMFGISNTVLALGMTSGSSLGGLMLGRALELRSLPYYWTALGMICIPSLAAIAVLGFISLRAYLHKQEQESVVKSPAELSVSGKIA